MLWTRRWRVLRSCHKLCAISIWQYERQTFFPCAAFGPVQWSGLLWCRGRKNSECRKKDWRGKLVWPVVARAIESACTGFNYKLLKLSFRNLNQCMGESSNTKELSYLFESGGAWVFLALTVLYSSTKTTAFSKVVCCQHFATWFLLQHVLPPCLHYGVEFFPQSAISDLASLEL